MDLLSIMQAIWRHRLAALPVILLTGLGVFYVIAVKPPVYQASANLLLLTPPTAPSPQQIAADPKLAKVDANNPYVGLGLPVAADAVLNVITDNATALALDNEGVSPNYKAVLSTDFGDPPIIEITGVGPSAEAAIRSANLVTLAARASLFQLQKKQGVTNQYLITSTELVRPQQATLSVSGKLRSLIAVLALGAIMLFVVVSVIDVLQKRRKDRPAKSANFDSPTGAREDGYRRPVPASSATGSPKNGAPRSGWHHYSESRPSQPASPPVGSSVGSSARRPSVRPDERPSPSARPDERLSTRPDERPSVRPADRS
jgi:hypothetical protein